MFRMNFKHMVWFLKAISYLVLLGSLGEEHVILNFIFKVKNN